MVAQDMLDRVRSMIADETGVKPDKIGVDAGLTEDLRIDGDDLVELMERFFAEFSVEPGPYRHADYIGAEGFSPVGKTGEPPIPLTVDLLAQAAERGRWPDA